MVDIHLLPAAEDGRNHTVATFQEYSGYPCIMNDAHDEFTPQLPVSTGRTRQLVQGLVQRRKDLGLTQVQLGQRIVKHGKKVAEKFGEPVRWETFSRQRVSQWETMFDAGISTALKKKRQSMSMFAYATWHRVLEMRMFVGSIPLESNAEYVLLDPATAKIARRIYDLPLAERESLEVMVNALWAKNKPKY